MFKKKESIVIVKNLEKTKVFHSSYIPDKKTYENPTTRIKNKEKLLHPDPQ